jgi:hopanoid biosynthesis associated RND transporter like protein HpnN
MLIVERLVAFCTKHARAVVAAGLLAAVASMVYTAGNFAMNSDSGSLISPDLPWQKTMARFDKLFPQRNNLILVVIDSEAADRSNSAANALAAKLSANPKMFPAVRRPDGGPYFEKNGLLFLPEHCVKDAMDKLVQAQPFLGSLAADPSLRGVMASMSTMMLGVNSGQAKLADIDTPMNAFADTLEKTNAGKPDYLSWQSMFAAGDTSNTECSFARTRTFIEVQPTLDYNNLMPGEAAENAIRAAAKSLRLTPDRGVTVRLTGPVPLSDEEFASLSENGPLMGLAMLFAITFCLWLAVHSWRIIACILATLAVGLTATTALGLVFVHVFNIISIAFIALFVGLGVDFAIQFSVRYRAERHAVGELDKALSCAGRGVGIPLALAAAATAAGFFSFIPTDYVGVAELGVIAGLGMVVAFVLAITFLPALIKLVKPAGEAERVGFSAFAPADKFLRENRKKVLLWGAAIGVVGVIAQIIFPPQFDANPLDLRSTKVESMSTLNDLFKDPDTSPNSIDVLAPNLAAADKLAKKIVDSDAAEAKANHREPLIGMALTLSTFIPEDQPKKLAIIQDTAMLLDATVNPFEVKPAPSDAEIVDSLKTAAKGLHEAAAAQAAKGKESAADKEARHDAIRLANALDSLAKAPAEKRLAATDALIPGLNDLLGQLRSALQAQPVDIHSMPPDLVAEWVAKDGTARIQVSPHSTAHDNKSMKRFSKAVLNVAPEATGTPITIEESGQTIVRAFVQAGIWSFIAISILLAFVLRRHRDIMLTIIPLVLTAVLTLGTCRIIGLELNFANIIALPLLFGIGVAFNIYFVVAWRAGAQNLLQSSLTRAVLFSALTTASGFGALILSSHPGTASMGILLMISLGWVLATTLFYLPALLGPPPEKKPPR